MAVPLQESSRSVLQMSFPRIHGGYVKGPGLRGSVKVPRDPPPRPGKVEGEHPTSPSVGEQAQTSWAVVHTGTPHPGKPQAPPHHQAVATCPLFSLHITWHQTLNKDFGAWDDTVVLSDLLLPIPVFPALFKICTLLSTYLSPFLLHVYRVVWLQKITSFSGIRIYYLDDIDDGRVILRAEKIFYVVFPMNFLEFLLFWGRGVGKNKQFLISGDSYT